MNAQWIRQRGIAHLGEDSQELWSQKKVMIIGCGGLGNGVLMSMARIGFVDFVVVDGDKVELSNLHRQWIFNENQLGMSKVEAARDWINSYAPNVQIQLFHDFVGDSFDTSKLPEPIDIVIDCTDQVGAKYWIDAYCQSNNIPWVMGSVEQWEGQVSVFQSIDENGRKWTYRDWVGSDLKDYMVGSCEQRGVFPPAVQWISQVQVLEACRICSGKSAVFNGKIGYWDMWNNTHLTVNIPCDKPR